MSGAIRHQATRHWATTHCGTVRTRNEDALLCRPDLGLFAVADGVGGQTGGAEAAAAAMHALDAVPAGLAVAGLLAAVRGALEHAHYGLLHQATEAREAATTVVVLLLHKRRFACLWAGDSRCYVLRRGMLHRLTSDHSLVGEMLRAGMLNEAQARLHPKANVITRAIGVAAEGPLLDKAIGIAEPGDRFLLCSDGLTNALAESRIARTVAGEEPAAALVAASIAAAARDNVTALVVEVSDGGGTSSR